MLYIQSFSSLLTGHFTAIKVTVSSAHYRWIATKSSAYLPWQRRLETCTVQKAWIFFLFTKNFAIYMLKWCFLRGEKLHISDLWLTACVSVHESTSIVVPLRGRHWNGWGVVGTLKEALRLLFSSTLFENSLLPLVGKVVTWCHDVLAAGWRSTNWHSVKIVGNFSVHMYFFLIWH